MADRHLVIGRQFVRFAIVGTVGFVVDASVLYFCLHIAGLGLYSGRLVSYLVAATTTWYLNRKFTFTNSDGSAPTRQWARFVAVNGLGGLINYGTYSFVVTYWLAGPMAPLIGVAAGSVTGLGVNFTASRLFVFKEGLPGGTQSSQRSLQVRRQLSKTKQLDQHMANRAVSPGKIKIIDRMAILSLQAAALSLMAILLIKANFDVDQHADSWWYHLPWAARLAGLMGPDAFIFEPIAAVRFEGFPVVPELLQGILWRVTGRVESANLVSFAGLAAFIIFLRHYFRVAWWLSIPALLAVPLVQAQVTTPYVDLFANLAMAAFVMLTFLAYTRKEVINGKFLALMVITAFIAANSKLQLIPLVALTLVFSAYPVIQSMREQRYKLVRPKRQWVCAVMLIVALTAIFFVPLKNIAVHGNPVYPIKVTVFGTDLNHAEEPPPPSLGAGILVDRTRAVKWLYSTFELGMGPIYNVQRWGVDSAAPTGAPMTIQGGLFGHYVIFHLLLLLWLLFRIDVHQRRAAIILVGIAMLAAALMPASNLLRYYMFWFLCVISLNLYFLTVYGSMFQRWLAGALFFVFVFIVIDASDQNFVNPRFRSVKDLLAERVNTRILQELVPNSSSCLALLPNEPFLYAALWHGTSTYRVKAGPYYPDERAEVEKTCEGWRVITSPPVKIIGKEEENYTKTVGVDRPNFVYNQLKPIPITPKKP